MAKITVYTAPRMAAIEAASIVAGVINGSGRLILSRNDGSTIDAGAVLGSVPSASPSVSGTVVLASNADVTTGTDTTKAVTPAGLASRAASAILSGLVALATSAEAIAGTVTNKAVTPAALAARLTNDDPPAPVGSSGGVMSLTSTAATYAVLPTGLAQAITNPRSDKGMLCEVTFGAWVKSDTAEIRGTLKATGALTWTEGSAGPSTGANGPLNFSENVFIHGLLNSFMDHHGSFTMIVPASGTVTLTMYGYRSVTTGTNSLNYPFIRITPKRYI